ncbi:adipogenesis regulatory factor [Phascolarctos cinereus]|uniref:Adipogenesis regulatory factor n=1 Tax=Phascolarctos cinereus TaxID=38626 RepID=A0A6P5L7H1_PHACI|nr:adipogenesis regulatory factor [Phascolarctos cinereus]
MASKSFQDFKKQAEEAAQEAANAAANAASDAAQQAVDQAAEAGQKAAEHLVKSTQEGIDKTTGQAAEAISSFGKKYGFQK